MAAIKPLDNIRDKWKRVAGQSGPSYEEGVRNPKTDWKTATLQAKENYKLGIQNSIANDSFAKGVNKAGTETWQQNAIEKGPARYTQGVGLADQKYIDGFQPYHSVIANLTLPPRGPKGDPKNINRVAVIAAALHKKKLEG